MRTVCFDCIAHYSFDCLFALVFFFRKKRKPYFIETMKFKSNAIGNNNKFSKFYAFVDEPRIIILGVKKMKRNKFLLLPFLLFFFFLSTHIVLYSTTYFFLYIVKYNDERVYAINQVKIWLNVSCSCLFSINSI